MANRYWVGGSGTSWHTADNWASTSGGAGGAGVPTSSDVVYFDSNSNLNPLSSIEGATAECHSLITTGFSGSITSSSNRLEVHGNTGVITLSSTTTLDFGTSSTNAELWVSEYASVTIAQNNATLNCNFNCGYEPAVSRAVVNISGNFVLSNQHLFEPDGAIVTLTGTNNYISAGFLDLDNYLTMNLGTGGKLISTAQAAHPPQTERAPVFIAYQFTPYVGVEFTGSNPRIEVTAPGTGYTKSVQSSPTNGSGYIARNYGVKIIVVSGSTGGTVEFTGYHGDVEFDNFAYTVNASSANFCGDVTVDGTNVLFASGSTVNLASQSGQSNLIKTIAVNNAILPNVAFANAAASGSTYTISTNFRSNGTFTFNVLGTLSLSSIDFECASFVSSTTTARTIALNDSTLNITGASWNCATSTNLTLTYGAAARINMTSGSAKTFAGGGKTWPTVNQGGAGTLSVTGNNTFTSFVNTVTGCTISFPSGTTTFTNFGIRGAFGSLVTLSSTSTLSKATGTVAANYLNLSNSTATGGAQWYAGAGSTDGGGNTGWIFSTASTGGFLAFF